MVKLSFKVIVHNELNAVWNYFSEFRNISGWDPNTPKCTVIRDEPGKVGSQYKIITLFNKKQSEMVYETTRFTKNQNEGVICLFGQNDMSTAEDQITCKRLEANKTQILYKADICLKGLAVLATPFIIGSLNDLTEAARIGCLNKARQMWGKAQ